MIQQSAPPFVGPLAAALVWAATSTVQAQPAPFPSGTIRFVAPFSASTPPDIISRIVAKELTEGEGWRVIVENRPGGVTTIAATDVLSQPADGHSLYAMSVPSVAAPSLVPNISFNLDKDFEPVIKATVSYNVLVVNPSVPARTVAELVALLKSQPDKLTFSSGGFGTPAHLIGEQFNRGGRSDPPDRCRAWRVLRYGEGADLLVHEVAMARPELLVEGYIQRIVNHHTSPQEAGRVFAQTRPKLAAFTHLVMLASENVTAPTVDELIAATRETYAGPLVVGEDLMSFEIGETVIVGHT